MSNEILAAPRPNAGDHAHTVVRAAISSIPVVGGAGVELFQFLVTPSIEKRTQEWMHSVAEGLNKLNEKHERLIEELPNNEAFIDTLMLASHAVIRTSQQEKKEALRNAVLNAALPCAIDLSRQQMFIAWIESYTPWHLKVLSLLANPLEWYRVNGKQPPQYFISSSLSNLLTHAFPDLSSQREFYEKLTKDLYNDGLTRTDNIHINMSASGAFEMRATQLGEAFLKFISDPTID